MRQFPVFSGYIFAGIARGQHLGRSSVEKIAAILGDACGPLTIPARAIRTLNELELAFHWDETRSWREKSPFQRGSPIRITDGAYASFTATVDALVSETRIRVLVSMFGRLAPVELDIEAIETI